MQENQEIQERVLLVGVKTQKNDATFLESMKELENLAQTAGAIVIGEITQNRQEIDRRTYVGKGKMEEITSFLDENEVDGVIFNHELSPRQLNLLEKQLNVKVIDRVQLILDIFAMRSTSKEGKMQVELAQLQYISQRLSGGSGLTLSRQGGGIGSRGPGESKLETDRRHLKYKMSLIRKELKENVAHRMRLRQKRKDKNLFQIGLIGYTNAGKSTTLNALTSAGTFEEDKLFATLDPLTKKWRLSTGLEVTLTDTVGFIQDLPTQLIEAFQSTLEVASDMDLLLHVVDASNPAHLQHEEVVKDLLKEMGTTDIPILTVYNKKDQLAEKNPTFAPTLFPNILISARDKEDGVLLEEKVTSMMTEILFSYNDFIELNDYQTLQEIKRETILLKEEYDEMKNAYHIQGVAKKESKWAKRLKEEGGSEENARIRD